MSRRPVNPTARRYGDSGGGALFSSKSRSPPYLPIALIVLGGLAVFTYIHGAGFGGKKSASMRLEGDSSCTGEIYRALPVLQKAYGDLMHKVMHVGPDTCSVVSSLIKVDEIEAWGVEPYDLDDADGNCRALVRKGFVRVADIKFPLPYRPKSFSLVIVSEALDYLSPKYLNKTIPDLARVSTEGIIVFTASWLIRAGFPGKLTSKAADVSKFGRAAKMRSKSWWKRYFGLTNVEINEVVTKKFEQAAKTMSYSPSCQIFHLKAYS
ncbi:Probable pectin methylesterase CGR3 [Linum perenne]